MRSKVNLDEAARVAAAADQPRAELITPFLEAAGLVLWQECREQPVRGTVHRVRSPRTSDEVSALVALTGGVAGLVIYAMSSATACALASRMMGEPVEELDAMAQSAIAELANVITGQASILLEQAGYASDISPPVLLVGHGSSIATFNLTRVVVPLELSVGRFSIDVAVRETEGLEPGRLRR